LFSILRLVSIPCLVFSLLTPVKCLLSSLVVFNISCHLSHAWYIFCLMCIISIARRIPTTLNSLPPLDRPSSAPYHAPYILQHPSSTFDHNPSRHIHLDYALVQAHTHECKYSEGSGGLHSTPILIIIVRLILCICTEIASPWYLMLRKFTSGRTIIPRMGMSPDPSPSSTG
jgi:hypothetical protein